MAYTSVKISADSSSYQSQMKSAASQMKVLSAEYTTAATKAKLFGSETDSLKAKAESLTQKITVQKNIVQLNSEQQEKLTKKLSDQKTKQEELKTKIDAAKEAYEKSTAETGKNSEQSKALKDELDKLEKEFTANETAIGKTETALANQTVKTEKSKTALMNMEAELKNVNDQLKDNKLEKFATACDTAGTKMESFGKKMSVVSAGIAGIGAASIKAFTELDEGYDTIVTKTGATGEALEGLTKSADNVFGTMPEDMSTVGEAIGEVNTRFHTTGTELEKTSKQFIQFASINGTNVTQSVDQVDKIMKAWNVDASQTGNLLGLLTAKAQETGISVDTLEGYVLDNNAQFKEMGLSLPQAINLMAQFDANGVDSTQAMAGLKKALQNATSEGKSMDEALSDTIGSIKNAKTETEAMQIATELFGKKGAAEMTKAIRENRIDLTSLSSSMEEYGSTVEDTYNGTLDPIDNAKVAMNNAKLALSTLASTAQTSAAPMIEKLTGKIQELTKWFTSLSPAQQETILKVGLVVAAIGPLSIGFGKVAKGISDTITTGQKFVSGAAKIIAKITAKTAATPAGTAAATPARTAASASPRRPQPPTRSVETAAPSAASWRSPPFFTDFLQFFSCHPRFPVIVLPHNLQMYTQRGHLGGNHGEEEILSGLSRGAAGGLYQGRGGQAYAAGGRGRHRGRGRPHGGHQPQCLLQVQGRRPALPEYAGGPYHHVLRTAKGYSRRAVQLPVYFCQFRRKYSHHQPDHPHQRLRRRDHLRRDQRDGGCAGGADGPRRLRRGRAEIRDPGGLNRRTQKSSALF